MKRIFTVTIAAGLLFALDVATASAQRAYRGGGNPRFRNSYTREPAVSPYLNLLTTDDMTTNYFNLVSPQVGQLDQNRQTAQNLDQMQGQIQQNRQGLNNLRSGGPAATGHSTSFMNLSHYYGNKGGGGGGRGSSSRNRFRGSGGGGLGGGLGGLGGLGGMGMGGGYY